MTSPQASELAFTTVVCPWAVVTVVASGKGVLALSFEQETWGAVEQPESAFLQAATQQLGEYFAGQRQEFDLPLDRSGSREGFAGRVHRYLEQIPYGTTQSYSQVAHAVGNPLAVRAVGSACGANPLPIIVPCHRVLRSDGTLGGYAAGLGVKRSLLDLEQGR